MADNIPVATAGAREPVKRPKPIPRLVKFAIELMICGDQAGWARCWTVSV